MRNKLYNKDEGVAGLTILLSLVTMLFVIGLLAMIFSLMGGEMIDATYTSTAVTGENNTVNTTLFTTTGYTLTPANTQGAGGYAVTTLYNNTNEVLTSGNYTLTGAVLTNATALAGLTDVVVTFSYTYDAENTATGVMNDTTAGISSVSDWFPIFIVIGAMVVLILLTVIIISAIRGSGLMGDQSA